MTQALGVAPKKRLPPSEPFSETPHLPPQLNQTEGEL